MLVILALLHFQGTLSLEALERDRQSLFEETRDKAGYIYGYDLSASHYILFPVRRGDVLYYLSDNEQKCVATCWERVAGKPVLKWQVLLKQGDKRSLTKGSLARVIYQGGGGLTTESMTLPDSGLVPDRSSVAWRKAKADFEQVGAFVSYDIRIHGDISLGSAAYVVRTDGVDVERFDVGWGDKGVLLRVSKTEFRDLARFKRRNPCQRGAAEEQSSESDPCSS